LPTLDTKPFSDHLEATLLAAGVEVRRIGPGARVFREGDPGTAAFFIRSGSVDIVSQGPEGEERLLNHLGKGELFGEMALLDQTRRSASAVARGETELLVVTRDEVEVLLQREPRMALWMLGLSSHRLRVLTRLISQMEQAHEVNLKILAGQEQERRRIGRDIHDGVAQSFAELILRLQSAVQVLDRDPEQARSSLDDLENGLRDTLEKIRELIGNLFPGELRRAGLVGAIDQFIDRVARSDELAVSFKHQGVDDELPAALEATLYCIVQEALNNVRKHAAASEAGVDLRRNGNLVELVIQDNGCGFDLDGLMTDHPPQRTYGLLSMQERTILAGGTMDVDSRVGAGTRLRFLIPAHASD
jgi:signal transduction histidine kinase